MRIRDRVSSASAWAAQRHHLVTRRAFERFSIVTRRASSPAVLIGCLMTLAATALVLRPSMTRGEAAAARGWASTVADTIVIGDTTIVYGPVTFTTVNGDTAWHIETFSITDTAQAHELVIQFGDTLGGAHRPDDLEVYLQGSLVATEADFAGGAWLLTIPIVPLASNDLEVMVSGSAGDYVRLAVLSFPSSAVTIFGPVSYTAFSHTFDTIALPPGVRAPYYFSFSSDDEATEIQTLLSLNGTAVFSDTLLSAAMTEVQLQALNELETKLSAPLGESGSIRITGTDDVDPVLTISTPSDSAIVSTTSVTLAGTVADATWVTLTVNGEKITVGTDGSFTESVPLTEGANSLEVIARDAAGNATQHELDVFRDKIAPEVTITTPVTDQVTGEDSVLVSGSAADASDVTVTFTRMVQLPDGTIETPGFHELTLTAPGGPFTGWVPLDVGSNNILFSAVDAADNQYFAQIAVVRDTTPPQLTVTAPADSAIISTDSTNVTGSVTDETAVTLTVNDDPVQIDSVGSFAAAVSLSVGANAIVVRASDAGGNVSVVERYVTRSGTEPEPDLPPDPATVAPPLDPAVPTNMATATSFLYTGANPIQRDVPVGAIDPVRVAVLRGRIIHRNGSALSGARIEVKDHPEFGHTLSRADGMYDLAVNGGGGLTLDIEKDGYLRAQRHLSPGWHTYDRVDDVALTQLDSIVTSIDLAAATDVVVARGSQAADADGVRQATLMFEPGTQATMVMPDGREVPISQISVRATEYTIGDNGQSAMPGVLPPSSAYTYAAEVSVDEAIAAGATSVRFSQPVPFYIENFLGFPTGTPVPLAYYDFGTSAWVPLPNGRIVSIVSVNGGSAAVDADGDGAADDSTALAALGFSAGELRRLAELYVSGETLWRMPLDHFSPIDGNYPAYSEEDEPPAAEEATPEVEEEDEQGCTGGSFIYCESQTLSQRIPVTGTPFSLVYSSNRIPGGRRAARRITIPVSGPTLPDSVLGIRLDVLVGGQLHSWEFPADTGLAQEFEWDGKDAYGRAMSGPQQANVRIGYSYRQYYYVPAPVATSFGLTCRPSDYSGRESCILPQTANSTLRQERIQWQDYDVTLGELPAATLGVPGWTLDAHHVYSPAARQLAMGDGSTRLARVAMQRQLAGAPTSGSLSTVLPDLSGPRAVVLAPDGSLYFTTWDPIIQRLRPDGTVEHVAGTGEYCFDADYSATGCGDGGPATQAELDFVTALVFGPDGLLYFSDEGAIRRINADGTIETLAGNFTYQYSGDDGPATQAGINAAFDLAVGADGTLYIADWAGDSVGTRVRAVAPDGIIRTIAGGQKEAEGHPCWGDFVAANLACLRDAQAIALAADGSLYIAEPHHRLLRLTPDGFIERVAGSAAGVVRPCVAQDGALAIESPLCEGYQVQVGPDGQVFFDDSERSVSAGGLIRYIDHDGYLRTAAGRRTGCPPIDQTCRDGGTPLSVALEPSGDFTVGAGNTLYVSDTYADRILAVQLSLPGFRAEPVSFPSEDGTQLYDFDENGRHTRTRDAATHALIHAFEYDSAGRLLEIRDGNGRVTTLERDATGVVTAIVAPFGQRTTLTPGQDGNLATVSNPANESISFDYDGGGLLTRMVEAGGGERIYTYDDTGLLISARDPSGAEKTLTRSLVPDGYEVAVTTELGRVTTYSSVTMPDGTRRRATTDAAEFTDITEMSADGNRLVTRPNGEQSTFTAAPDPRWGMQATTTGGIVVRTPSGLESARQTRSYVIRTDSTNLDAPLSRVDTTVANGRVFVSRFDAAERTYLATSAEGRTTTTLLDSLGRAVEQSMGGMTPVTSTFDLSGFLVQTAQGARSSTFTYNSRGLLETTTDAVARTDSLFYDLADRLTRQVLPDGNEIIYGYDVDGNLTSLAPPGRPAHTFIYNAVGLDSIYDPPDVGLAEDRTFYTYNADRDLTQVLRPDGLTVSFAYDSAGRIDAITAPTGIVDYTYDGATGQLEAIAAPGGEVLSFEYDGSLPVSETWTGTINGTVGFVYNNDFRLRALDVAGASILYDYDGDGLLVEAGDLTLMHDSANGLLRSTSLAAVTTRAGHNALGELTGDSAWANGVLIFARTYTRDNLGRIATVEDIAGGTTTLWGYGYDIIGRLETVTRDGQPYASYAYDANGNRLSRTSAGGVETGTYDAQDRLLAYGNASYTYTANGELATKVEGTDTTRYAYDVFGNLTRVDLPDSTVVEYVIDGRNRRIGKKINGVLVQGFLYGDQLNPVAELDGMGNVVSRFVYGSKGNVPDYVVKGGVRYRVLTDQVGSVRLVVNVSTGAVVQGLEYDAWGGVLGDTNPGWQPFGFAGGIRHAATPFVRFGARDYAPHSGRWVSKDRIRFAGAGANLYGYATQDPINFVDPNGEFPLAAGLIGGALSALNTHFFDQCATGGDVIRAFVGGFAGGVTGSWVAGLAGATATVGSRFLWGAAGGFIATTAVNAPIVGEWPEAIPSYTSAGFSGILSAVHPAGRLFISPILQDAAESVLGGLADAAISGVSTTECGC